MKRKPLFATFGGRVCCYTAATHGVGPKAAAELDANEALRGLGCYTAIATMQRGVPLQRGRPDCSNLQQSRTAQACGKLQHTAYDIRLSQGQSQLKKCQKSQRGSEATSMNGPSESVYLLCTCTTSCSVLGLSPGDAVYSPDIFHSDLGLPSPDMRLRHHHTTRTIPTQRAKQRYLKMIRDVIQAADKMHTACDAAPTEVALSLDHLGGRVTS